MMRIERYIVRGGRSRREGGREEGRVMEFVVVRSGGEM